MAYKNNPNMNYTKSFNNYYYTKAAGKPINRSTVYLDTRDQHQADLIKGCAWVLNDGYAISQPTRSDGASRDVTYALADFIEYSLTNYNSEFYRMMYPGVLKEEVEHYKAVGESVADMCGMGSWRDKLITLDDVYEYMKESKEYKIGTEYT